MIKATGRQQTTSTRVGLPNEDSRRDIPTLSVAMLVASFLWICRGLTNL